MPPARAAGWTGRPSFFGIVVDGSGLLHQAERALCSSTCWSRPLTARHPDAVTREPAGVRAGLAAARVVLSEVQRRSAPSPLETGALAAGTPMGAWVAQGGAGRRGRRPVSLVRGQHRSIRSDGRASPGARWPISRACCLATRRVTSSCIMAQLVTETLNAGGQLLLEAGTGTGKSLAYLLPARSCARCAQPAARGDLDRDDHASGPAVRTRPAAGAGRLRRQTHRCGRPC